MFQYRLLHWWFMTVFANCLPGFVNCSPVARLCAWLSHRVLHWFGTLEEGAYHILNSLVLRQEWLSLIFMTVCWCNGEGRSRFAGQMVVNHQNIADGCIYIIYIYVLGLHWTRNLCLYQLSESSMMDGLKPYRILWGVEAMTYICHHTGYMYVYLCTPNILGYT